MQNEMEAPRNSATTDALVDLLARFDRGGLLSPPSHAWLMSTLLGTNTGSNRLKGLLPEGTPVAHKTGIGHTIEGITLATNDIGIVTMPNGTRFAIAVMVVGAHGDAPSREAVIAKLARASWDAFVR